MADQPRSKLIAIEQKSFSVVSLLRSEAIHKAAGKKIGLLRGKRSSQ
jgi:hypothetical protein